MTAYAAPTPHKDGGYVCGHRGCTSRATIAESLKCTGKCEQARAEQRQRYDAVDWQSMVSARVDADTRQAAIAELQADWRKRHKIGEHTHPHYRCTDHAGDLGKHVAEAAATIAPAED